MVVMLFSRRRILAFTIVAISSPAQRSPAAAPRSEMPVESVRVVPWTNWAEWCQLRLAVLRNDLPSALSTLSVYRLRRPSSLPSSLQSTVTLLSLLSPTPLDPHTRRLALSMALVRLVNGATDSIQPRAGGASARSVHSLAKVLRIPPQLVDIRHTATHSALPRLDALEDAAIIALGWLEESYWAPQSMAIGMPGEGAEFVKKVLQDERSEVEGKGKAREEGWKKLRRAKEGEKIQVGKEGTSLVGEKRSRRSRWTACSAKEWDGIPVGLFPGEAQPRKLMGIDVSGMIGCNWKPNTVVDTGGVEWAKLVEEKEKVERESCARRDGAEGNGGDPLPGRPKVARVLSGEEKDAVARMMEQLAGGQS